MKGWQPISTAPKDQAILIWDGSEVVSAEFLRGPGGEFAGWDWVQHSDSGRVTSFKATHWMPLPEPPAQDP